MMRPNIEPHKIIHNVHDLHKHVPWDRDMTATHQPRDTLRACEMSATAQDLDVNALMLDACAHILDNKSTVPDENDFLALELLRLQRIIRAMGDVATELFLSGQLQVFGEVEDSRSQDTSASLEILDHIALFGGILNLQEVVAVFQGIALGFDFQNTCAQLGILMQPVPLCRFFKPCQDVVPPRPRLLVGVHRGQNIHVIWPVGAFLSLQLRGLVGNLPPGSASEAIATLDDDEVFSATPQ
mmetsp:Transcript_54314/g.122807  ORF Transcript_54314/g.122807 Transcript_54314/m.122807 type:complete len:241 (-) Transcript_54314:190-912(-)